MAGITLSYVHRDQKILAYTMLAGWKPALTPSQTLTWEKVEDLDFNFAFI
jgi:hypothetical protein